MKGGNVSSPQFFNVSTACADFYSHEIWWRGHCISQLMQLIVTFSFVVVDFVFLLCGHMLCLFLFFR